jgi:TolB-like protein/Flp pilus assembly protein TadD
MGDGVLVEFPSAVAAVENALTIQKLVTEYETEQPKEWRIRFRVGINVGDVIVEDDDIHGEGVNVAARLEGLCEPGEIYVSGTVYDQAAGKLEASFEDLGEQTVRNIAKPVRTFRVRNEQLREPPASQTVPSDALPLPDKPSIAVLPFENMSGDAEQEYFADGIAEDVITALSRFHWFFVIARNSSFSYKGTSPDVRKVAKDLGVKYVLEGSVRKAGNRTRVTAQLIDALTGHHVWAERYDRDLDDIFAVQDEITEAIAAAVAPSFVSAEARRVERTAPENFDAWDHVMRGNWCLWRMRKENVAEARRQFAMAIERDPTSAIAYSGLAEAHNIEMLYGWGESYEKSAEQARRAATKAIELDDGNASAHCALAFVSFFQKDHDAAIELCERALAINPNLAIAEAVLGGIYCWTGNYDETIKHVKRSERLSPRDPVHSLWAISQATAEFCEGRYEIAADLAKKVTESFPNNPSAWRMLTSSCAHCGRDEDAKKALEQLLNLSPGLTIEACRQRVPAKQTTHLETYLDGLRKAGMKEN